MFIHGHKYIRSIVKERNKIFYNHKVVFARAYNTKDKRKTFLQHTNILYKISQEL